MNYEELKIELETLTPISIKDGGERGEIIPIEYYIDGNNLIIIDFDDFIKKLLKKGIDLEEVIKYIEENIDNRFEINFKNLAEKFGIAPRDVLERFILPVTKKFKLAKLELNKFVLKTQGGEIKRIPYIPGSSIKGAIDTLSEFKYRNEILKLKRDIKEQWRGDRRYIWEYKREMKKSFNGLWRHIFIEDVFLDKLTNYIEETGYIFPRNKKVSSLIFQEFIEGKGKFKIKLPEENITIRTKFSIKQLGFNKEDLIKYSKEYYSRVIQMIELIVKKISLDESIKEDILKQVYFLKEEVYNLKENEFILNVGSGGSKYSKTLNFIDDNVKTIKLAGKNLLGWIKCRIVN